MRFDLLHPADQLVMMMSRIYNRGMTTTSGGNLSIRDAGGDVWITPSGVDKGSLTRDDIMRILPDGTVLGPHKPSSEYPFHLEVYRRRPEISAVLHAHSPGLVAFSIARVLPEMRLTPELESVCGSIAMADYRLPGSEALGDVIADSFAEGHDVVLLENHGVVIGADTIFRAFMRFETLENSCRLQINALRLGRLRPLSAEHVRIADAKRRPELSEFIPSRHSSGERALRRELITLIRRSYAQGLFSSTQGTYSARLDDGSFLITPYGQDRAYLEVEDLILIRGGMREAGKTPSRSVGLHELIYRTHPDVRSILVAHPPHIMAFAVTEAAFDPRTIPESYILLRDPGRIPFGASFMKPEWTAAEFSARRPLVICENDCVIVTGQSLLNAFDRLEVAEFTAKSILESRDLGPVVHIGAEDIADIDVAFRLGD
ncbi:MAG: class II aldolase/adducin family protein [Bacillota bacterium]|nr:class II aldolase/adducin family protein [Bacillota bacterium]